MQRHRLCDIPAWAVIIGMMRGRGRGHTVCERLIEEPAIEPGTDRRRQMARPQHMAPGKPRRDAAQPRIEGRVGIDQVDLVAAHDRVQPRNSEKSAPAPKIQLINDKALFAGP